MPSYHCSIKAPLTKAKGKSLIAKAAYNARSQYRDERDGQLTRNYESHGDVLASYVQYDDRIKAPDWVKEDHQKMLNEAVKDLRKNGREGQEIILGLIDELGLERNRWMLNDFLREQVCRKTGHVVFVNIHPPSGKGDERNLHAHVLLMPKGLDENGFTKPLPSLTPQDYDRIRDKWAEHGAKELHKEASRMRNDPAHGMVRMYRGIDPNNPEQAQEGWMHFSTDRMRAADFGKLHYVDITTEEMLKFERAHSERFLQLEPAFRSDWITADPAIIARMRPLNPDQLDLDADRYRWGHLKLRQDPEDRKTLNGNNQHDKAKERGDQAWMVHCDREPQRHLGPEGVAMEDKFRTRKAEINAEIKLESAERQQIYNADRLLASLPAGITVPLGIDRHNVVVWLALERSKTAAEFRDNLTKEGWKLARVDKDDVEIAKSRKWLSERLDGPHRPELREGDYVAVNSRGMAFFLNERSTGKTFREMKDFTAALDGEFVQSVRAAETSALRELGIISNARKGRTPGVRKVGIRAARKAARAAGSTLEFGVAGASIGVSALSLVASAIDRTLTPEQRVGRNLDDAKKKLTVQRAERAKKIEHKQDFGRER